MAFVDAICDYGRTQRIVLLIDVNPLLLPDPNPYIATVISAARTLLSFPPLSSSLFSFKLFYSSLSPILSSSKLPVPFFSLFFDHPTSTLNSLSQTLDSVISTINNQAPVSSLSPRALHVAGSMRQLFHDYAWDSVICDSVAGTLSESNSAIKSNLVVLFSPIVRSLDCLSEFLGVEADDECLKTANGFSNKFYHLFENVKEAFISRDIHFCWVDVMSERKCDEDGGFGSDESELGFGFFESGIRDLGWGVCSSDSIILGSALVPFGLIYPKIGILPNIFYFTESPRKIQGQLSLEILDVSGKPLVCKCCDLELLCLKKIPGTAKFVDSEIATSAVDEFRDGLTKIHVRAIQMYDKSAPFEGSLSDPILVSEFASNYDKAEKEICGEFFEDRVLKILSSEMGGSSYRKCTPIWQIFLSFLYREGCWALVSLSNSDGHSVTGILRPFTFSSALLSIIDDKLHTHGMTSEVHGAELGQFVKKKGSEVCCRPKTDSKHSCGYIVGSTSGCSPSKKHAEHKRVERKKDKKDMNKLHELTWTDFCKTALENLRMDLEEVYFARNQSKKLKFLKCWLKQIKKSANRSSIMPSMCNSGQDNPKEPDNRLTDLPQESEQPIASCASVGEDSLTGASRIQDEVALDFQSETLEGFFIDLPHKIQQGLESEDVELESLAIRLVNSSIYWLYQKCAKETASEGQTDAVKPGNASPSIIAELTKLLLKDPKDLAAMHRNSHLSDSQASHPISTRLTSEDLVRQSELQILFRMEILQSEVGLSIGEPIKQKFVKQICLLLETIQCHLKGGFFGDWSLDKYVGKIIKRRYCQSLEDVVHRIYTRMDLLLFADDDDESPNALLNSEDSNQSWGGKPGRDNMDEHHMISDPVSREGESHQPIENKHHSPLGMNQEEHARKLIKAEERRQRARRFASFWVPDLQRVWAPKQTKAMKLKSDTLRKLSKRKQPKRGSYDMVCETPMTGKKSPSEGRSSSDKKEHQGHGATLCSSVSKALFQGD